MIKTKILPLLMTTYLVIGGCVKNEDNADQTQLKVYMSDNPYNATEVNVDIHEVRINYAADIDNWHSVPTHAGIYNLLDYQNGLDTLLAAGPVPADVAEEIRFVLGGNNSIVIDGTQYPLTIPSGSSSGLKIKLQRKLIAPEDALHLDFDAALSIHQTGNGQYMLKPVIKPF